VKLNSLLTKEEKRQVQILAVSIDSHEISNKFAQHLSEGLPQRFDIPMVEDKDHKVIDRYGIFNPDGRGWPHPATYVVNKQGRVRWRFVEVDYRERASNEQILQALRAIP